MEKRQVFQAVADIAGIPVAPEPDQVFLPRHEPAMQPDAVLRNKIYLVKRQSQVRRVRFQFTQGKVDEMMLNHPGISHSH